MCKVVDRNRRRPEGSLLKSNYTEYRGDDTLFRGSGDRRKRVRTPVVLLRSLSVKYPWKRYEPPNPPSYGLNSTTTVLLGEWLWHLITFKC